MINDCVCPQGVLETIDGNPCKNIFGKVAKLMFRKANNVNIFEAGTNGIELASSWTGLPDAIDDTKVVITPPVKAPIFAESDIDEGSENFDGAPTSDGNAPQLFTFIIENPTADQVKQLNSLRCIDTGLSVLFLDRNGKMLAKKIADTPNVIHAFNDVSDSTYIGKVPSKEDGRNSKFQYMIQFYLPDNWYENSDVVTPEDGFNPFNDVKPA